MIDHNRTYKTFPCLSCGQERASGRWVRELSRANDVRAGFVCLACDWGRADIGSVVSREEGRDASEEGSAGGKRGMSGWRTVDSAKAKPAPGPGNVGMRPKWPDGVCKYEMDDGRPCGVVFERNSHNQQSCSRHTAHNVALVGPRVARKRKAE